MAIFDIFYFFHYIFPIRFDTLIIRMFLKKKYPPINKQPTYRLHQAKINC